jgi:hypothetical protein
VPSSSTPPTVTVTTSPFDINHDAQFGHAMNILGHRGGRQRRYIVPDEVPVSIASGRWGPSRDSD